MNNVTTSFNFSIYNDNFLDSGFGIQSDRGWSTGADVSWRPHERVALSLGYDHQQLQTKELAVANTVLSGETANVTGDAGPTLTTSDSYDTFIARADFKLIPKKLTLTTRASYSIAHSNFNNSGPFDKNNFSSNMANLNEYYADIRTFLTYQFNEHWAVQSGIHLRGLRHAQSVPNALPAGNHCDGDGRAGQSEVQYPGRVLHERHGACGAGIFTVQVLA